MCEEGCTWRMFFWSSRGWKEKMGAVGWAWNCMFLLTGGIF